MTRRPTLSSPHAGLTRAAGRLALPARLALHRAVPCGAALYASTALLLPGTAAAQIGGLQPNVGTDLRVGNLRPQLESFLTPATSLAARPAWIYQPAMEVDVGVTDNAARTSTRTKADIFTTLSPQLVISGDASRVKVNLSYAPQFTVYASTPSQNQVSQFFNGQVNTIIVPDVVFVDFRGAITQQSLTGSGFNQYQTQGYNQQNSVQTTTVSIAPYAQQRFGGWGTGRIGYTIARSLQDSGSNNQNINTTNQIGQFANTTPSYGSTGNLTTQSEVATFDSGENLGRVSSNLSISATQYNGGGSYVGAYRREIQNEFGYALDHTVTMLAGIGYQDIRYGGTPPVQITGATYNVGIRYNPNPDTNVTVTYGRRDGGSSLGLDGQYSPTARMRIIARYGNGITTDLEQSQNSLNGTSVGSTGIVTDTRTGAPVSTTGYGGIQNGVYRSNRFSGTLLFLQNRDTYALNANYDQRTSLTNATTLVGNNVVPAGTTTDSASVSVSWQHDLAPTMSTTVLAQYGTTTNTNQLVGTGGGQQQRTISLTAALTKQFTETLSGNLRYTFNSNTGAQGNAATISTVNTLNGNYTENIILAGLRKSF